MAYVVANKGVLLSDPALHKMSIGQLVFEANAIRRQQQSTFEAAAKAFRLILVSVLGLNALRPEDENGVPKTPDKMTQEEKDAFIPMIAWVARPEMLKILHEQSSTEDAIKAAENNREYEKLVAAIDAAGGDMEPIIGIHKDIGKDVGSGVGGGVTIDNANSGTSTQASIDVNEV